MNLTKLIKTLIAAQLLLTATVYYSSHARSYEDTLSARRGSSGKEERAKKKCGDVVEVNAQKQVSSS